MNSTANNAAAAVQNTSDIDACKKCQDLFPGCPEDQAAGTISAVEHDRHGDETGTAAMLCSDCCDSMTPGWHAA